MRNDFKQRPRPAFKGGGIAKRGFGRALYAEGTPDPNVTESSESLKKKRDDLPFNVWPTAYSDNDDNSEGQIEAYEEASRKMYKAEKDENEKKGSSGKTTKYIRKYLKDPIKGIGTYMAMSATNSNPAEKNRADLRARKDVLGYKKGGKIKKTITKNRSKK